LPCPSFLLRWLIALRQGPQVTTKDLPFGELFHAVRTMIQIHQTNEYDVVRIVSRAACFVVLDPLLFGGRPSAYSQPGPKDRFAIRPQP